MTDTQFDPHVVALLLLFDFLLIVVLIMHYIKTLATCCDALSPSTSPVPSDATTSAQPD